MFVVKCGAKARTNNHKPCRQPAMANGRCRLHGGKSIGPKTEDGKKRLIKANMEHGFYCSTAVLERKKICALLKKAKENLS